MDIKKQFSQILNVLLSVCLILPQTLLQTQLSSAQTIDLPKPGTLLATSHDFIPPLIKGIKIFPKNPLRFDFILDPGQSDLPSHVLRNESEKLLRYFLAAMTVPENDFWVNLSPYEQDRIIPDELGMTELGRDMLAQDYILKQITASLLYPESGLGEQFWNRVYEKALLQFGTTDIPIGTFNKVWIVPSKAVVYEGGDAAFVVESELKVLLEEDYLSLKENLKNFSAASNEIDQNDYYHASDVSSKTMREIILPALEREINNGEHFAPLRQIYHAIILATWFKESLKQSVLWQTYADHKKMDGIDFSGPKDRMDIYNKYLQAFKIGAFNYIKEDYDPTSGQTIPRKYFSGGAYFNLTASGALRIEKKSPATIRGALSNILVAAAFFMISAVFTPLESAAVNASDMTEFSADISKVPFAAVGQSDFQNHDDENFGADPGLQTLLNEIESLSTSSRTLLGNAKSVQDYKDAQVVIQQLKNKIRETINYVNANKQTLSQNFDVNKILKELLYPQEADAWHMNNQADLHVVMFPVQETRDATQINKIITGGIALAEKFKTALGTYKSNGNPIDATSKSRFAIDYDWTVLSYSLNPANKDLNRVIRVVTELKNERIPEYYKSVVAAYPNQATALQRDRDNEIQHAQNILNAAGHLKDINELQTKVTTINPQAADAQQQFAAVKNLAQKHIEDTNADGDLDFRTKRQYTEDFQYYLTISSLQGTQVDFLERYNNVNALYNNAKTGEQFKTVAGQMTQLALEARTIAETSRTHNDPAAAVQYILYADVLDLRADLAEGLSDNLAGNIAHLESALSQIDQKINEISGLSTILAGSTDEFLGQFENIKGSVLAQITIDTYNQAIGVFNLGEENAVRRAGETAAKNFGEAERLFGQTQTRAEELSEFSQDMADKRKGQGEEERYWSGLKQQADDIGKNAGDMQSASGVKKTAAEKGDSSTGDELKDLMDRANEALKNEKFEEARDLFNQVIQQTKGSSSVADHGYNRAATRNLEYANGLESVTNLENEFKTIQQQTIDNTNLGNLANEMARKIKAYKDLRGKINATESGLAEQGALLSKLNDLKSNITIELGKLGVKGNEAMLNQDLLRHLMLQGVLIFSLMLSAAKAPDDTRRAGGFINSAPIVSAVDAENVGGIDLSGELIRLKTRGDKILFDLPQDASWINAQTLRGLTPVILQMSPTTLPLFLGGDIEEPPSTG